MVLGLLLFVVAPLSLLVMWLVPALRPFLVVRKGEAVVLERAGRFARELRKGWHWLVPLLHRPRVVHWQRPACEDWATQANEEEEEEAVERLDGYRIPTNECSYDLPAVHCATQDGHTLPLQLLVHYRIANAYDAVYHTSDLYKAMADKLEQTLLEVALQLRRDDVVAQLPQKMRGLLQNDADWKRWGLALRGLTLRPPEESPRRQEATVVSWAQRCQEDERRVGHDVALQLLELQALKDSGLSDAVLCAWIQRPHAP